MEAILITGVIYAKQKHNVITLDVQNAFVQTHIPKMDERIIMKIQGALVDILLEICTGGYNNYVIF